MANEQPKSSNGRKYTFFKWIFLTASAFRVLDWITHWKFHIDYELLTQDGWLQIVMYGFLIYGGANIAEKIAPNIKIGK